jgi:serine/threonine protein kinase
MSRQKCGALECRCSFDQATSPACRVGFASPSLVHRTDVFSLGVVMNEMLALVTPFDGDTTHQIAESILLVDPPYLRQIKSRVPKDLGVICAKALEKARQARYQSMREFAADLRCHLSNEPIHAKPATLGERGLKWVQRHPTKSLVSVVGGIGLLGIAGIGLKLAPSNDILANTNGVLLSRTEELSWTNSALEAKSREVQEQVFRADADAADARKGKKDVYQLSLPQDYSDLMLEADLLWPVCPVKTEGFEAWLKAAQEQVSNEPLLQQKRSELRATALK